MAPTQALPEAVTVPLSNARYNMSDSTYSVYIEGIDSGLRGSAILHPPCRCSGPSMKPTSLVASSSFSLLHSWDQPVLKPTNKGMKFRSNAAIACRLSP